MNYHYRHSVAYKFIVSIFYLVCNMMTGISHAESVQGSYSPYANEDFPRQVYWGDTHLHSNLSVDANMMGNIKLGPADAYRFARGETITAHNGMPVRLQRPLDFLVVSDHAEYLGWIKGLRNKDKWLLQNTTAQEWEKLLDDFPFKIFDEFAQTVFNSEKGKTFFHWEKNIWHKQIETAEIFYEPGKFTTLIGYEWSSTPGGDNLHRVVIYGDGEEKVRQTFPFSTVDSSNPEDLWDYLEKYQKKTDGKVLAIPHNSNGSGGRMFSDKTYNGEHLTRKYAEVRSRLEPIVEVTQYKGDSETHPYLSPVDEFADYETWDKANLGANKPIEPWMFRHNYVRSALKLGLQIESQTNYNPYRFGMIGSTDAHTSLATADENNFLGKFASNEPSPDRISVGSLVGGVSEANLKNTQPDWKLAASGYAAVWATENTREAIFDAMKRRETYATTGPRMVVRFFGGWTFDKEDMNQPDIAKLGYGQGVPMGGVLERRKGKQVPRFLITALKDPDGANLDRVQVIKGWLDKKGNTHEKVYDVSWSGDRKKNEKGKLPAVGNTVDIGEASYTNSIGAVQLTTVWEDPDFNADESAFYYVRVIEIPTPRWTAYDAKFFNIDMPDEVPMVTQDRAYTSPIWYQP